MPKRKRAGSNNLADQTCPTRSKTQARVPNVPASAEEKDKCIQELMDGLKHVKDDLKRSEATQNDLKAAHAKQLAEKDAEANIMITIFRPVRANSSCFSRGRAT